MKMLYPIAWKQELVIRNPLMWPKFNAIVMRRATGETPLLAPVTLPRNKTCNRLANGTECGKLKPRYWLHGWDTADDRNKGLLDRRNVKVETLEVRSDHNEVSAQR